MTEEIFIKTEHIEIEIKREEPETSDQNEKKLFEDPTSCFASNSSKPFKSEFVDSSMKTVPIDIVPYQDEDIPIQFTQESTSNELEIKGKVYENGKINRLSCEHCDKTFKNRANLKNHLKYVHSGNHTVECMQCFRTFKSHVHLRSHLDSVHAKTEEVNCHICEKVFQNPKKLKNHIYFAHPQPTEQVTCTVCSKVYKSPYNLKIHMRQVHPEGQTVPCPQCDKTFKCDMLLQRHIKWSHPNDGMVYKCQQCFKILPSLACFKKHIENTHDPASRATCQLCNRIFKTKKTLDRHLKNVHNGKEVKPYKPREFACSFCGRMFESNTNLFWHVQKYHQVGIDDKIPINHCETCNKSYSDNASLQRHMASVHSLETATCKICFKEFKSSINLQSHMRITHAPPEATQHCDICKKTFKCALHLRMHVSTVHTDGQFNCEVCDKSFTSMKYLSKHTKTHSEVRDHPCSICGKMFKTLFAANKHRKNVHNGIKCSFCQIKQANLDSHLLVCPVKAKVMKNTLMECEENSKNVEQNSSFEIEIVKVEKIDSESSEDETETMS